MGIREDYIFWKVIDSLTKDQGFTIITMSEDHKEVWLEQDGNRKYNVLRLMRHDFDGANTIKKDLTRTVNNAENIRKHLFKKPISVLNVYLSLYKPVDAYDMYIDKPIVQKKMKIDSLLMDSENAIAGLEELDQRLGTSVSGLDFSSEPSEDDVSFHKEAAIQNGVRKRQEEQKIFQHGKVILTKVFLAIQIVIFLLMELSGSSENTMTLVEFGAKFNPGILDGEWWRFITPVFVHIGFLHLLMNSAALLFVGAEVEKIFGSVRFMFIYLFAGFAGVLFSFIFSPAVAAGASGAIFGCLGALLYFGIRHPKLFLRTMGMNIIALLLINLVFGFTVPGVDNAGHIGGLIGGFIAAAAVGLPKNYKPLKGLLAAAVLLAGTAGLLKYGFDKQASMEQEHSLAYEYVVNEEYAKAEAVLKTYVENDIASDDTYLLLGVASEYRGNDQQAEESFLKAIELNPEKHEAHINLASLYLEKGDVDKAEEHVDQALEINPGEEIYQQAKEDIVNWKKANR